MPSTSPHIPFRTLGLAGELDFFIENLGMLAAAGMPISEALESIGREVRSRRMKRWIRTMRTSIEGGGKLSDALRESGLFRESIISLVRIGEGSGRLAENLAIASVGERKSRAFRSKIHSAVAYPVFVFVVTLSVGVGIAWFILPKLALVFSQLHIELPRITRILIGIGIFLGRHGQTVVPSVFAAAFVLFFLLFSFSKTKAIGQYLLLWTPGVRTLIREVETARFGSLLGDLLEAGIPVVPALDSLADATESAPYRALYRHMRHSIEEGCSFQKALASARFANRLVPLSVEQLIIAGERSGNLPGTLRKIGELSEGKVDTASKNLSVLLEPVLLVLVWLGVVSVAFAVILPIYSLIGGLNRESAPPVSPSPTEVPVAVPDLESAAVSPETPPVIQRIRIKETGIGYLNVRKSPAVSAERVSRVSPGSEFGVIEERGGWFLILLSDGTEGWVAGEYSEKVGTPADSASRMNAEGS